MQVSLSSLPCLSTSQIYSSERVSQAFLNVTDAVIVTAPKSQQHIPRNSSYRNKAPLLPLCSFPSVGDRSSCFVAMSCLIARVLIKTALKEKWKKRRIDRDNR